MNRYNMGRCPKSIQKQHLLYDLFWSKKKIVTLYTFLKSAQIYAKILTVDISVVMRSGSECLSEN